MHICLGTKQKGSGACINIVSLKGKRLKTGQSKARCAEYVSEVVLCCFRGTLWQTEK